MRRILVPLLALVLLAGAALILMRERPAPSQAPVVLAAASLQEALEAAAQAWAAKGHPQPILSFAASSALARQVEAGAPADLFISADEQWMDMLESKDLIQPESRATLLGNRLVLIAPAASKATLTPRPDFAIGQALGTGRLAMADPAGVPAGRYARQALEELGVWNQVADRLAAGESVRAALKLVAQGEAPLGVVYATDATAEPRVRVVFTFPANSHTPITYPMARLRGSHRHEAGDLRLFLLSAEGQAIFRHFGFTPPPQ